jgi:hypothetical protein
VRSDRRRGLALSGSRSNITNCGESHFANKSDDRTYSWPSPGREPEASVEVRIVLYGCGIRCSCLWVGAPTGAQPTISGMTARTLRLLPAHRGDRLWRLLAAGVPTSRISRSIKQSTVAKSLGSTCGSRCVPLQKLQFDPPCSWVEIRNSETANLSWANRLQLWGVRRCAAFPPRLQHRGH